MKIIFTPFLRRVIFSFLKLVSFVEDWTVKNILVFFYFPVLFVTKVIRIKNLTFFV